MSYTVEDIGNILRLDTTCTSYLVTGLTNEVPDEAISDVNESLYPILNLVQAEIDELVGTVENRPSKIFFTDELTFASDALDSYTPYTYATPTLVLGENDTPRICSFTLDSLSKLSEFNLYEESLVQIANLAQQDIFNFIM